MQKRGPVNYRTQKYPFDQTFHGICLAMVMSVAVGEFFSLKCQFAYFYDSGALHIRSPFKKKKVVTCKPPILGDDKFAEEPPR